MFGDGKWHLPRLIDVTWLGFESFEWNMISFRKRASITVPLWDWHEHLDRQFMAPSRDAKVCQQKRPSDSLECCGIFRAYDELLIRQQRKRRSDLMRSQRFTFQIFSFIIAFYRGKFCSFGAMRRVGSRGSGETRKEILISRKICLERRLIKNLCCFRNHQTSPSPSQSHLVGSRGESVAKL